MFECDQVAILFDQASNVLLKHGPPEMVQSTYALYRETFMATPSTRYMAEALVLVQGAFPVEEINKVVSICDYIGRFYERLSSGSPVTNQP